MARLGAGLASPSEALLTTNLFSPSQALELVRAGHRKIWGWFAGRGVFTSVFIAIFFIYFCIQFCCRVTSNAIRIREAAGCSMNLLLAIWSAVTRVFLFRRMTREMRLRQHFADVELGNLKD